MAVTNLPGGLTLAGDGLTVDEATSNLGALVLTPAAVTATVGGAAVPATASFVSVTSSNAAHIVTLPAPVVGKVVMLHVGSNGFELRSSAPASIAINGGTGASAESAIPANTLVIAVCTTLTSWQAIDLTGTTLAAVEAAA